MILGAPWFIPLFGIVAYLLVFCFIIWIAYMVIRRAVKDGIMEARANIKELEEPSPFSPYPPTPQQPNPSAPQPPRPHVP